MAAGLALVLCAVLAAAALGNFSAPPTSPELVGDTPRSIAVDNFDGDGDLDLAVANDISNNVTILRNNGAGNFNEPASSPEAAGDGPNSVIAADLDTDGDRDLAVANIDDDTVTVLLNDGNGNFTEPASSPEAAGNGPISIAWGDFDGDIDRDLAVADHFGDQVTVLRNNGFANFSAHTEPAGDGPYAIVAREFIGGGLDDLAVANINDNNLTILRAQANTNFTVSSSPATGLGPAAIAPADFNADTDQDLAVANSAGSNVTILRNRNGTFVQPVTSPELVGSTPYSIAAAPIDGDSDADLAVGNSFDDTVTILHNNGVGGFAEPGFSPELVGDGPLATVLADLDGDLDRDLATANANGGDVTILKNR